MTIDRIARGHHVPAAGQKPRARNHARVNGLLQRDIDIVHRARTRRAGVAAAQQQLGVLGRNERQIGRRIFHVNIVHVADIGVGDMIVALDHARHEGFPTQIIHHIFG